MLDFKCYICNYITLRSAARSGRIIAAFNTDFDMWNDSDGVVDGRAPGSSYSSWRVYGPF